MRASYTTLFWRVSPPSDLKTPRFAEVSRRAAAARWLVGGLLAIACDQTPRPLAALSDETSGEGTSVAPAPSGASAQGVTAAAGASAPSGAAAASSAGGGAAASSAGGGAAATSSTMALASVTAASAEPRQVTLSDPLSPGRPFQSTQQSFEPQPSGWEHLPPAKELQYMRSVEERGGELPCEASDPGLGLHDPFTHVRPMGQLLLPRQLTLGRRGELDLVVHFHGQRPAGKELRRTGEELALLGVSLGVGAAYGPPFRDGKLIAELLEGARKVASRKAGREAQLRRLALVGWSRGFEAIGEILVQPSAALLGAEVDAVILLDSFHGSRDLAARAARLEPFVAFARRAAAGERLMFVSYSSIPTREYASTTETTRWLIATLGGEPIRARRRDPLGLELFEFWSQGSLHTRGYAGNGKLDHCAHFGVLPDALRAVATRWRPT